MPKGTPKWMPKWAGINPNIRHSAVFGIVSFGIVKFGIPTFAILTFAIPMFGIQTSHLKITTLFLEKRHFFAEN
jgi:ABC-type proline/glycine betaine transport system permease subunit